MLLMGPFAMLSMPSFDFHLPPCTEGFLIHLSPLWQLPLFPSVEHYSSTLYSNAYQYLEFEEKIAMFQNVKHKDLFYKNQTFS